MQINESLTTAEIMSSLKESFNDTVDIAMNTLNPPTVEDESQQQEAVEEELAEEEVVEDVASTDVQISMS